MSAPGEPSLAELLEVRAAGGDGDRFVADTLAPPRPYPGLYGGQVAAQALVAAAHTVAGDRLPHSLHGYFLRRGDARVPVTFDVERDRDGRSYSARTVVARQEDRIIFRLAASFCLAEAGPDRQAVSMPTVRAPKDSSPVDSPLVGVELRDPDPDPARLHPARSWVRAPGAGSAGTLAAAAALVYVSDVFTGLAELIGPRLRAMASLDHAVWFHRPVRMDEWVLMDHAGASVAAARGFYRSTLFDRSGAALASCAQEMVIREE